ncbi:MAG TPA: tetratricopeptide repeat protein [Bacteroidetes bacterium]|nr:tetratricopeptide repeat protein [Bacteroidota bacterium]
MKLIVHCNLNLFRIGGDIFLAGWGEARRAKRCSLKSEPNSKMTPFRFSKHCPPAKKMSPCCFDKTERNLNYSVIYCTTLGLVHLPPPAPSPKRGEPALDAQNLKWCSITILLIFFLPFALSAQDAHKFLLRGDKSYDDQNFEQAELNYRKALEKKNSAKGTYNLGNTTYRQERYDEAINHYTAAAEAANDRSEKARAYYNLGNAHYQAGQYKESIEAYKNALRQDPTDIDTKKNLLRAIRKLPPPQQQQQQQNGEGDKNQDQQDQQQNQQQQQQQQQDKQDQQDQSKGEKEKQQQQNQNESSKQQQEQAKDLSKEEAEKLLEIMDQEEQKVQQKMRKGGAKKKQAKDW